MKNKKLWSLGLTGVLVVTTCGCGGNVKTANSVAEENAAEEAAQAVEITERAASRSADGDAEKEETVYVNADANGKVKNITVSNWLKNGDGADELTDVTSLTDVVNVKGDETFTQNGDTYVWAAEGNDIYYQGETSEALPVDVKVTYYLDEKEISPDELAGKSGKVKIRFDYENLTSQKTVIGGEEAELCVPFVAASTLILDSDKFVNVEVENGKVLSDGKNTIVAGVAMPGLYDSLDLLNLEGFEDIDIPEYVEVTADVTEFELGMTATILMPDVLSELDTDDMDGFDDLKDDIEELNDATYELIDGCIELDDGVQELKDNMPDLWDGAVELDDGAKELDDGAQDLMDGADELNDGAKDIREGAKELDAGIGTLQSGVGLLNSRMPELTGGVNALAAGLQSLQNPMMLGPDGKSGDAEHPYIKTSVGLLKNGVDTLVAGVSGIGGELEKAIAENEKAMVAAQSKMNDLSGQLDVAGKEVAGILNKLQEIAAQEGMNSSEGEGASEKEPESSTELENSSDESSQVNSTDEENINTPEETENKQESQTIAPIEKGSADVSAEPDSASSEEPVIVPVEEPDAMQEEDPEKPEEESDEEEEPSDFAKVYLKRLNEANGMSYVSMVQTADGAQETEDIDMGAVVDTAVSVIELQTQLTSKLQEITNLQTELQKAVAEYAALEGANTALKQIAGKVSAGADAGQLTQLTEGMAALEASIGQIYDGLALINSQMGTLTGGATELGNGIGALKTGTDALKDGSKKLYQGGIDLREGTKELYDGTQELKDGTEELRDGTQELKDGVVDLIDGVDELKDGTEELLDGVNEYNDDGIQKLYDAVNVDLQNLLDRVDAIADLSGAYQSFSGKSDAMEGSVKFIIETEAIELDED